MFIKNYPEAAKSVSFEEEIVPIIWIEASKEVAKVSSLIATDEAKTKQVTADEDRVKSIKTDRDKFEIKGAYESKKSMGLEPRDWHLAISKAKAADTYFPVGLMKTSNEYLNRSNDKLRLNPRDKSWGPQDNIISHLLGWYGNELIRSIVKDDSSKLNELLKIQRLLLIQREEMAKYGVTMDVLKTNFEMMNDQLEAMGFAKCKSLTQ